MGEPCVIESGYLPPSKDTYNGDLNYFHQRNGQAEQIWQYTYFERYKGDFFQDSLHGHGTYTCIQKENEGFLVEGTLYTSSFNGYCTATYSNRTYFEGLMRRNKRFGPGVLIYPDGKQDVGLWSGPQLKKLCFTVHPEHLPKLAHTPLGKIKLLRFKKLVSLCDKHDDVATDILKKLGAPKAVLQISNRLYNPYIRNPHSLLFDRKLHDEKIYGESSDCFIDIPESTTNFVQAVVKDDEDNVAEVVDYLTENANDLSEIPEESRVSAIQSKIFDEKPDLAARMGDGILDEILRSFLKDLAELLKLPKEERSLILLKRDLIKKLPHSWKIADVPLKRVEVTHILAWNNEEHWIEMLKYVFQNMKMEKNLSFKVRKLLIGDRSSFGIPGDNENACIRFLQECCLGNYIIAAELLVKRNLNPDVCDARGNSAVMFAAAKDKWRTIKMLSNFGANLDMLNDDGLSPLYMCILRYITFKEDILDWEQAFLNDIPISQKERDEARQWRPHSSLVDLRAKSMTSSLERMIIEEDNAIKNNLLQKESLLDDLHIDLNTDNLKTNLGEYYDEIRALNIDVEYKDFQREYEVIPDPKQKYIFTMELPAPAREVRRKSDVKKSFSDRDRKASLTEKEHEKEGALKVILTTIKILLRLGCDPNYCFVPMPAMLMAIYSKSTELTDLLIQSGANPNAVSISDGLTPLLLLAGLPFSSENTALFQSLLDKGADTNQKTKPNHWEDEKIKLRGKCSQEAVDEGKSAIHILSMRYDFEDDFDNNQSKMVKSLLGHNTNPEETYVGHTPFSIAILRGNIKLIQFYIESKSCKPYAVLGENMGTPLTVLILKRYNNVLPIEKSKEIYDVLTEYNFNPLVVVSEFRNAIDFMEVEYEVKRKPSRIDQKAKDKKSDDSKKKEAKGKRNSVDDLKDYLVVKTREMLQRNVLAKACQHLRMFMMLSTDLSSEIIETLVNFFNMNNIAKLLQTLINRGVLEYNKVNVFVIYMLLNVMDMYLKKKDKSKTIGDIFHELTWEIIRVDRIPELVEPEIDDRDEIYHVCFYCCKKLDKILIVCPICGLIYFCSQECNRLSIKEESAHKCKHLYYDKEKQRWDNCIKSGLPYKENNRLQEALDLANDALFNILKRKYGSSAAVEMLEAATKDGAFDIDALLKSCDFLRDSIEDKLGIAGEDVNGLIERLKDTLVVTQPVLREDSGKKTKKSSDQLQTTVRSGLDIAEEEEGEEKEGKKKGDEKRQLTVKGKKKKKSRDEVSRGEEKGFGKGTKKAHERRNKKSKEVKKSKEAGKGKKVKGKDASSRAGSAKKGKKVKEKGAAKGKAGAKERGDIKDKSSIRDKPKGKTGSKDKSKASAKGKESAREKGNVPKSESTKTKKPSKEKARKKSSVSKKSKSAKGSTGGRLETSKAPKGSAILGVKETKASATASEKGEPQIEDQFSSRQGPLSCIQYVGKKDLDVKTLPTKCQFLLEELARLFPDFDFSGVMWPFVVYCDGQLYYRFLDNAPLFIETLSTI